MTEHAVESFLAVLKAGSISAAAEALYVTQPALSRAINALEKELGYPLIRRHKGVRTVELTEEGSAFLPVAEKWKALFHEARGIAKCDRANYLNVASVGSVSTYILPDVFRRLLDEKPGCHLNFRNMHSQEAYAYVGGGQMDLAIISDDMYDRNVQTIPLFRERMVLVAGKNSKYQTACNPAMLDANREIRLPWNPEFDLWHDFWFRGSDTPLVFLDQMQLLEFFIVQADTWALAPVSVARELKRRIGISILEMEDAPPDRIIYLLLGKVRKPDASRRFLDILMEQLRTIDGIDVYPAGQIT